jgi:anti-sigma B factor antagonist
MAPSGNIHTGIPSRTPLRSVLGAPRDLLRIAVRYALETTVVELAGELDLATVQVLDARLAALGEYRLPRMVIDVTALTFCDCSGLGALVRARNEAVAGGGWLRLCGAAGMLAKMIKIARMASVLPGYPSVADALAGPSPDRRALLPDAVRTG